MGNKWKSNNHRRQMEVKQSQEINGSQTGMGVNGSLNEAQAINGKQTILGNKWKS